MLDADQSGSLDIDEFCDAISRVAVSELPPEQLLMYQSGWSRRISYGRTRRLEPTFVPISDRAASAGMFARSEVAYVPTVLDRTVTPGADAHVHALAPVFRFDLADDDGDRLLSVDEFKGTAARA